MFKFYAKSKVAGKLFLVFTLTTSSLLSGPWTVNAASQDSLFDTLFNGSLDTEAEYFRPQMPGDVSYDDENEDNFDPYLLEKTWYFLEGEHKWFDNPEYMGAGEPFTDTVRKDDPDGYKRNYFYRMITPIQTGDYSISVTESTLEDTVLYLYKDDFDYEHPLHNLIAGNDDISEDDDNYLSQISNISLEAGATYFMVMTGFSKGETGNVAFRVTGPDEVGYSDPDISGVTNVSIDLSNAEMVQGEERQLTATVMVVGDAAQTVDWTSNDTSGKVLVDKNGKVSVASDTMPGDYKITATSTVDNSKYATTNITVTAAPNEPAITNVSVDPSRVVVVPGEEQQLTATVTVVGEAAQTVDWTSDDTSGKVLVDETGKVTVASDATPGDYSITATSTVDSSKYATSIVTVTRASAVTSVSIDPSTAEVVQGGNQQLTATVTVVGNAAQTVNWTKSDISGKISVDKNGLVTVAPDTNPGYYTIIATSTADSSKYATSIITVRPAPAVKSVSVDPNGFEVKQGENRQLTATVDVVGGAAQTVHWTSDDTSGKVLVDETGKVTVASDATPGDYIITATSTVDSSKYATSVVTVTRASLVTSVSIDPSRAEVVQGGNQQLTATVTVVGDAAQTVNWTKSDISGKISVDKNGLVTVAPDTNPGYYTIIATSTADSSKYATSIITVRPAPAVKSVSVDPNGFEVKQGENRQLTATVDVVGGATQTVDWTSDDTSGKVMVDEKGKVTVASDATPGDYIITATSTADSSKYATSVVTVTPAPAVTSVTVDPSSAELVQGENRQLFAKVTVVGGAVQTVNWTSSDTTGKVSVDKTGKVTVASDAIPGDYTITATSTADSSKFSTSTISVTPAPAVTNISVDPSEAEVKQGENRQLTATVAVVGGAAKTVNWTSDDTSKKVSVDEKGKVTVASDATPGEYTITATSTVDSSKYATSVVTVRPAPGVTSVTVDPSSAEVKQGENRQLTATVAVVGGAAKTVNWTSDDTSKKVSVDEKGKVTVASDAIPGDYTITATSAVDSSKYATSVVTVTQASAVTSVTVDPSSAELVQGENRQLTAKVTVVGGAGETVNWTSSDPTGKVSVDKTGKVMVSPDAIPGDYTITATSVVDNSKHATTNITVIAAPAELTYKIATITDQKVMSLIEGYNSGTQETKNVIVSNIGTGNLTNLKAELTAGEVSAFEITSVQDTLKSGDTNSFVLKAKNGLTAGTYTAIVTLSADNMSSVTFQVTQVVNLPSVPEIPQTPVSTTPVSTTPSQQPADTEVEVLVNGEIERAGKLVNSILNNQTVSMVIVDPNKLNEKLAQEGDHAVVTIPVINGSDVVIGELDGQMIKNLEQKQAVVKIQTNNATYTLPAQEIDIDAISKQIGQTVPLRYQGSD
ncbi:hypothetical protein J45TS6_35070 [Paenibacillus sp. J45TS6]|uniref:Ig-like domain-containing protein n=1 Tax=Paenibacillus sp. J45TS6 TaxID=2807196 RepID=UPI001B23FAAA|nr:Ig-like domain-containing protein [Paenibacillus sp. J45TS6]GIP45048.1 hypothetical protein J45TS6_35070 [Paenibacillus sp. J45TS6]